MIGYTNALMKIILFILVFLSFIYWMIDLSGLAMRLAES